MGPNYISNMVATAQASSSTAVPKPPTRENRAAAAGSTVPASSSSTSQSVSAEALVSFQLPTSPAQVRSNTRHIATQRLSDASTAFAPPSVPGPLSALVNAHNHQSKSNVSSAQPPVAANGISSGIAKHVPTPSATSKELTQSATRSLNLTQYSSSKFQSAAPSLQGVLQRTLPSTVQATSDSNLPVLGAPGPATPTNQQSQIGIISPRTPSSADKRHLARDILRSLGGLLNGKRKRSEEPPAAAKRGRT